VPARLRQIVTAAAVYGVRCEEPSSGSHYKLYAADGKMYPVPAGNGYKTEIDDKYIKKMCRALGLVYEDLKKNL